MALFFEPLVMILGSTETIAPYAADYLRYLFLGMPFIASSFVLSNLLRYQGSAAYAMIGILALRLQFAVLPLSSFTIFAMMMTQTIGKSAKASVLAFTRQGLFFVPFVVILPRLVGILGVQISQPLSDVCAFILALILTLPVLREMQSKNPKSDCGR